MAPPPRPPDPDRRKLLVALGYAAANVAVVSRFGGGSSAAEAQSANKGPASVPAVAEAPAEQPSDHIYDLVIAGGRVIDPDSGFDRVANVGIDGDTISAVEATPLRTYAVIDATDRVVAPGFIDLLSYKPNTRGARYKIADGVTTNLGMHGINDTAENFFAEFDGTSPVHFGGAFDHPFFRSTRRELRPGDEPSRRDIADLTSVARDEIAAGWMGVDFEPEYVPGTTFDEMVALAEVANEMGVSCFIHGRYSAYGTNADTLGEVIRLAEASGAHVHVEHLISTGGTFAMAESLEMLEEARSRGVSLSACMYPYDFWATYLGSNRFRPGWQERFRIDYGDLQVGGTSTRLDETSFERYQADNALVAAYAIPEEDVRTCLGSDMVMIGSDAIYTDGNNHPRATGCFSRTLGRYARDAGVLSLPDALAKMTSQPATLLERAAPALARKGRLQRGADADVVVFDPATIIDRSTVDDPGVTSAGIDHVLIAGQSVLGPEGPDDSVVLGQPVRSGR